MTSWLDRVYGQLPGLYALAYVDSNGRFHGVGGCFETLEEVVRRVTELDRAAVESIYLRTTTLKQRPANGRRGSAADSHALPGLWGDVDFGDAGHAFDQRNMTD